MLHFWRAAVVAAFLLVGAGASQAADACDPMDQLPCACTDANVKAVNATVKGCFLGDFNFPTFVQADSLSAQAFAAINWPVATEDGAVSPGMPDYSQPLPDRISQAGGTADWNTVWDTWKPSSAVFRPGGPLPWDDTSYPLPQVCQDVDVEAAKAAIPYADQIPDSAYPRLLDEYVNPDGHALLDKNKLPVRFEISYNKQAYDYIADNRLWDKVALDAWLREKGALSFPYGEWADSDGDPTRGAMVLKTAWMQLDENADPSRFHKTWAYVTPVVADGDLTQTCDFKPFGLVGIHIVYKTKQLKDWVWATYEHYDAAPYWSEVGPTQAGQFQNGDETPEWLFYDRDSVGAMTLNKPPASVTENRRSRVTVLYEAGYYYPTVSPGQPVECFPSGQAFRCFNDRLRAGFEDSVFVNYRFKGSQWRNLGTASQSLIVPEVFANVTMETYTQLHDSCMTCHAQAGPRHWPKGKPRPKHAFDFMFSFDRDVMAVGAPPQEE